MVSRRTSPTSRRSTLSHRDSALAILATPKIFAVATSIDQTGVTRVTPTTRSTDVELQGNLEHRQAANRKRTQVAWRRWLSALRRQSVDGERVLTHRGAGDQRAQRREQRDDSGGDDRLSALWVYRAARAAAAWFMESRSDSGGRKGRAGSAGLGPTLARRRLIGGDARGP